MTCSGGPFFSWSWFNRETALHKPQGQTSSVQKKKKSEFVFLASIPHTGYCESHKSSYNSALVTQLFKSVLGFYAFALRLVVRMKRSAHYRLVLLDRSL